MVYMPYTTNPHIAKVRAQAVRLVREKNWNVTQAARHFGVNRATVHRWLNKAPQNVATVYAIETSSSRPKSSPRAIDPAIIERIVELRLKRVRCAEVIHAHLLREGITVSLSTVKRTLDRRGLLKKRSPWKQYHLSGERPKAEKPGILVQMDSIHLLVKPRERERFYIVTLIDCFSRWAHARAVARMNTYTSLRVMRQAHRLAPFDFQCIQSDHGPEFSKHFSLRLEHTGIRHRHSRVRKPNDNAHVERFNRTIQEELRDDIRQYRENVPKLNRALTGYLKYYNNERLHMGINLKTPTEVLQSS